MLMVAGLGGADEADDGVLDGQADPSGGIGRSGMDRLRQRPDDGPMAWDAVSGAAFGRERLS